MLRLSGARRALLSADCELTTVTEVAMCFGFVELGRFSVEYRRVFGESPSQTLCRASHIIFDAASGATGYRANVGFGA
jgi:transcriptional regulator GlxA family with amidase domain